MFGNGTQDGIETTSPATAKMGVGDLPHHGLRHTGTEIVKDINRQAVSVTAEAAVLEEIDHPITVAHQVEK